MANEDTNAAGAAATSKPSVVVVTDTDVAAVPFAAGGAYSFRLDKDNKGPFAAMLPLSQLQDPAAREESIATIRNQFSSIPYGTMRDRFLGVNAGYYVSKAIVVTGNEAEHAKTIELYLDDKLKHPSLNDSIYTFAPYLDGAKTGREVMERMASAKDLSFQQTTSRLSTEIGFFDKEGAAAIRKRGRTPEIIQAGNEARQATAQELLGGLGGNALTEVNSVINSNVQEGSGKAISEAVHRQLLGATEQQREALTSQITSFNDKYRLQTPTIGEVLSTKVDLGPNYMQYNAGQIKAARDLQGSPETSAVQHYEAMGAAATAQGVKPGVPASLYKGTVDEALAQTPVHIAVRANATSMKAVIVGPETNINDIMPNNMGLMGNWAKLGGGSTGQGIYAKANLIKYPAVLKEEIIHEVERHAVTRDGKQESFSLQPEWQRAISKDVSDGRGNPTYQYLLQRNREAFAQQTGFDKVNATLTQSRTSLDPNEPVAFVEAVPDVYHLASAADGVIAKDGKIRIGGFLRMGGTIYTTRDGAMQAALPNAWPMLEGPGQGMSLVQQVDGTVSQIAKGTTPPAGSDPVLSLKEHTTKVVASAVTPAQETNYRDTARQQSVEAAQMAKNLVSGGDDSQGIQSQPPVASTVPKQQDTRGGSVA